MTSLRHGLIAGLAGLMLLLTGCATPTAVSSDSEYKPDEGLVVLRLVGVGDVPISRFTVVSESSAKEYPLRAVQFGQTSTMTYVGHLPAGRYRPKNLFGSKFNGYGGVEQITVPLAELTGKFDVETRRVTDLGTMIFTEMDGKQRNERASGSGREWNFAFGLPLDPTPVPTAQLLAARFPLLAKASAGKSSLGWVAGTVPSQPARWLEAARARTLLVNHPTFIDGGAMLAGGSLGVIGRFAPGTVAARRVSTDAIHAIESVVELKDGRWLAGGEEGYLAVGRNGGASWERLPGLGPEAVVIHLSQAADGRLFMVADLDREVVVYESAADPIAWKVIRRIPAEREQGLMQQNFIEAAKFLSDFAAASRDRLVVYTRPNSLSSLDLRTGQWETHETPRTFHGGFKVTPDGFVVGMFSQGWVYTSADYGKSWNRMESWVNMTQPHFVDRNRGMMFAADLGWSSVATYKLRTTDDGGKTWKAGDDVGRTWRWLQPLWTDASGTTLFTTSSRRIEMSTDQGRTWR